jgi:hypothetical protein
VSRRGLHDEVLHRQSVKQFSIRGEAIIFGIFLLFFAQEKECHLPRRGKSVPRAKAQGRGSYPFLVVQLTGELHNQEREAKLPPMEECFILMK